MKQNVPIIRLINKRVIRVLFKNNESYDCRAFVLMFARFEIHFKPSLVH